MTSHEILAALAILPDDATVTLTLRKADLLRALDATSAGPEVLSTAQAARLLGYTTQRWRRWAEAGRIAGAWQDADRRWRLPRRACEAWLAGLARKGLERGPRPRSRPPVPAGQLEIDALP